MSLRTLTVVLASTLVGIVATPVGAQDAPPTPVCGFGVGQHVRVSDASSSRFRQRGRCDEDSGEAAEVALANPVQRHR